MRILSGMSFDNYAAQDIKPGKTVKATLHQLKGSPVLEVEHAGESNRAYMSEIIAFARGQLDIEGQYDEAAENETIVRLKGVYARTIVRGIDRVFHDNGEPATKDDIPEFLEKMPRHAFKALIKFCRNPINWIDTGAVPIAKPEAVAGK